MLTNEKKKVGGGARLLVEQDDIYVHDAKLYENNEVKDTPEKAIRKFIRSFRQVWETIPEADRMTLLSFWRSMPDCNPASNPRIFVGIPWAHAGRIKAGCSGGHEFGFDAMWIDLSSPLELRHLVAHELGHAISYPNGWYKQHVCNLVKGEECLACECQAFAYMASWGFDPFLGDLPSGKRLCERFWRARKLKWDGPQRRIGDGTAPNFAAINGGDQTNNEVTP